MSLKASKVLVFLKIPLHVIWPPLSADCKDLHESKQSQNQFIKTTSCDQVLLVKGRIVKIEAGWQLRGSVIAVITSDVDGLVVQGQDVDLELGQLVPEIAGNDGAEREEL